jgi:uncharacterized protein (TIGR03086 family)
MSIDELRRLHARATEVVVHLVDEVRDEHLGLPTPCGPWSLRDLLAHMTGQDAGFAAATTGDAGVEAYLPGPATPQAHRQAAEALVRAFAAADPARPVWLAEFGRAVPLTAAVGFHLLDTLVHGWDVAVAVGLPLHYDDELAATGLAQAEAVPDGPLRDAPGAAFAHALPIGPGASRWYRTLALTGRDPHWTAPALIVQDPRGLHDQRE